MEFQLVVKATLGDSSGTSLRGPCCACRKNLCYGLYAELAGLEARYPHFNNQDNRVHVFVLVFVVSFA